MRVPAVSLVTALWELSWRAENIDDGVRSQIHVHARWMTVRRKLNGATAVIQISIYSIVIVSTIEISSFSFVSDELKLQ